MIIESEKSFFDLLSKSLIITLKILFRNVCWSVWRICMLILRIWGMHGKQWLLIWWQILPMKSLGSLFQVGYYYYCYYFSVYYHVKKINRANSCYGYFHYVLYSLCSCKGFGVIFVFGSYLQSMQPPRVGGREEDQKPLWEGQSRRSETKQGGRAGE